MHIAYTPYPAHTGYALLSRLLLYGYTPIAATAIHPQLIGIYSLINTLIYTLMHTLSNYIASATTISQATIARSL